MAVRIVQKADGSLLLAVKVVPGSSRERVVGPLGEALRVTVSAPPEGGKANKAVCRLLAEALRLPPANVTLDAGGGTPFKTIRLVGLTAAEARARLGLDESAG